MILKKLPDMYELINRVLSVERNFRKYYLIHKIFTKNTAFTVLGWLVLYDSF